MEILENHPQLLLSRRSNSILYNITGFGVLCLIQTLHRCIISTWNSSQRHWHLCSICMRQIEIQFMCMRMQLNSIHYMCCFILVHTANQWLISTSLGEPLSLWFRRVSTPVLKSKEMCFARRILRSF
ncbi:hypothetical protein GLYMA_15G225932v4 [Glycine max]|nr:hypothetical protein GLYMA_15G225932v4 [Glycine max]KAH1148449.1 hypothetical protein GYH30_043188 [Glycine max]